MYNNESQFHDPKGQGQPPPYTDNAPSDVRNMPYTNYNAPPPMMPPRPVMAQPAGVVYQGNINMMPTVVPVVVGPQMGPRESPMTCPACNRQIVTRVEYKSTTRTHLFAALLCIIGCWPCACIPYFLDSCRNADHYCPSCNAYIGSYVS